MTLKLNRRLTVVNADLFSLGKGIRDKGYEYAIKIMSHVPSPISQST